MNKKESPKVRMPINEDWWAVIVAFLLILLSAVGLLGGHGLQIKF